MPSYFILQKVQVSVKRGISFLFLVEYELISYEPVWREPIRQRARSSVSRVCLYNKRCYTANKSTLKTLLRTALACFDSKGVSIPAVRVSRCFLFCFCLFLFVGFLHVNGFPVSPTLTWSTISRISTILFNNINLFPKLSEEETQFFIKGFYLLILNCLLTSKFDPLRTIWPAIHVSPWCPVLWKTLNSFT